MVQLSHQQCITKHCSWCHKFAVNSTPLSTLTCCEVHKLQVLGEEALRTSQVCSHRYTCTYVHIRTFAMDKCTSTHIYGTTHAVHDTHTHTHTHTHTQCPTLCEVQLLLGLPKLLAGKLQSLSLTAGHHPVLLSCVIVWKGRSPTHSHIIGGDTVAPPQLTRDAPVPGGGAGRGRRREGV